ncbi:hypothetical protein CH330_06035 [candidate division WOR-3 bacterium JGI_Cruoil_03_51_56]|uniref:Uncharacterized protein n=1 Tax=candidate division WOR-3 bacterium JGI_Cruoil_03_51_56 TaxID=1973747 RepID=A0A235BSV6_UNCW3|nr:MAG: hypothetical protein CH330_06035 [candidate division WOR-3 bacterium JGI_Cruoil_03_51_56]
MEKCWFDLAFDTACFNFVSENPKSISYALDNLMSSLIDGAGNWEEKLRCLDAMKAGYDSPEELRDHYWRSLGGMMKARRLSSDEVKAQLDSHRSASDRVRKFLSDEVNRNSLRKMAWKAYLTARKFRD